MEQIRGIDIALWVIAAGALILVVLWFRSVLESSEDEGKNIIKNMFRKRTLLFEGLLFYMNASEAAVASSLAASQQSEISFPLRVGVHGSISGMGAIFGFTVAAQWQEAFNVTMQRKKVYHLLSDEDKSTINRMFYKEWFDALFAATGAIVCPLLTLFLIAHGAHEVDTLFNPFMWSEMSPLLIMSSFVVALHIPCVFYLGWISSDKIMGVSLQEIVDNATKSSQPKLIQWSNITNWIKKWLYINPSEVELYIESDPAQKVFKKRDIYRKVTKGMELKEIIRDMTTDDDLAQNAEDELTVIMHDLKTKIEG